MQEFESISASSYDPSALATKLTAKAAEGWTVVAIVPTGGDVTAFLARESEGGAAKTEPAAPAKVVEVVEAEVVAETAAPEAPAPEPEPEKKPEPASEPSGWAIAPEAASPAPAATSTPAAATPSSTATPAAMTPAASMPAAATSQPVAATAPAAARAPEPAPSPAVPAGWYADPAGRYELRYWDGGTWTEHVSRAGQQFTDPPVA